MADCPVHHFKRFCVTGASGYLASWLIMRLLERGYFVRGTVRDLRDKTRTAHLLSLAGASENLELVRADLLEENSLLAAVQGCDGVFSVAAPLPDPRTDQGQQIEPCIDGALNVLRACKKSPSVKRVVMTSTCFTVLKIQMSGNEERVLDESIWTSVEYCRETKMQSWGYMVGKTMAEKAVLDFAEKNNIDVVTILPSCIGGPFLTAGLPDSVKILFGFMTELAGWMRDVVQYLSYVHIEDVVNAHIFLMENSRATGRYLCSAADASLTEVADVVTGLLGPAGLPLPKWTADRNDEIGPRYKLSKERLQKLGFVYKFDTLEKILRDSMRVFIDKGYLG